MKDAAMADAAAADWAKMEEGKEGEWNPDMDGLVHLMDDVWVKEGYVEGSYKEGVPSLGMCRDHCMMYAEARGIEYRENVNGGKCMCVQNWDNP